MTNQTYIATQLGAVATATNINHFITTVGMPAGYINFEIKPPIVTPQYVGGVPTGANWVTVMVNYYDPAIM